MSICVEKNIHRHKKNHANDRGMMRKRKQRDIYFCNHLNEQCMKTKNDCFPIFLFFCYAVCLGWTRPNRYSIVNVDNDQIFYVYEGESKLNTTIVH